VGGYLMKVAIQADEVSATSTVCIIRGEIVSAIHASATWVSKYFRTAITN
jgi:hypothetical protein